MRKSITSLILVGAAACATTAPSGPSPSNLSQMCLPCTTPCTHESSCKPKVAVAPAPQPPPPAPTPPPPPEPTADPTFSPPAGAFTGPVNVELSSATPGAVIHYTTDGTPPTANSPVYSGPIPVTSTTTVQAIALAPGKPDSGVASAAYNVAPPPPPPRVVVTKEKLQLTEKVFFDTGKATIQQRSYGLLDDVAAALKDHPEVQKVIIEGHTDNKGGAAKNLALSKARAESVRKYLVTKGVEKKRLAARGFGAKRPVADNKTEAGREENRRVEFVIAPEAPAKPAKVKAKAKAK